MRARKVDVAVHFTSMDLTYDRTEGYKVSHSETISLEKTWQESLSISKEPDISFSSAFSLGFSATFTQEFSEDFTVS